MSVSEKDVELARGAVAAVKAGNLPLAERYMRQMGREALEGCRAHLRRLLAAGMVEHPEKGGSK